MSTSLLYHAYGISGVQYKSTKYEKKSITIYAEMVDPIQCKCGCMQTIFKGQKTRIFKMVPFGGKSCFLKVLLHRVKCHKCKRKWWAKLPFMKGKYRMTRSLILHISCLLNFSTILDVSRFLKISWNVIKKIHKKSLLRSNSTANWFFAGGSKSHFSGPKLQTVKIRQIAIKRPSIVIFGYNMCFMLYLMMVDEKIA